MFPHTLLPAKSTIEWLRVTGLKETISQTISAGPLYKTERERNRERDTHRERHRERDRERQTETDRGRQRQTDSQREREREREREEEEEETSIGQVQTRRNCRLCVWRYVCVCVGGGE